MKQILIILFAAHAALAQTGKTGGAGISGTVVDAKTLKPIPSVLVLASRTGAPPSSKNTRSGGDGAFQIEGLASGDYLVCVQAPGEQYLDPCQWSGAAVGVRLAAGQVAKGIRISLTPASVLNVEVKDEKKILSQLTKEGRGPDMRVGVWGPGGMYYPARAVSSMIETAGSQGSVATYSYRLAVPRGITLKLDVASRDVKLGDGNGAALVGNASQQAFQHAADEAKPLSFTFVVLGKLP